MIAVSAENPDPPREPLTIANMQRAAAELKINRTPMCCIRVGVGAWCQLDDGHAGDHVSEVVRFGPVAPLRLPRVPTHGEDIVIRRPGTEPERAERHDHEDPAHEIGGES